jgi:hypothetical protein
VRDGCVDWLAASRRRHASACQEVEHVVSGCSDGLIAQRSVPGHGVSQLAQRRQARLHNVRGLSLLEFRCGMPSKHAHESL